MNEDNLPEVDLPEIEEDQNEEPSLVDKIYAKEVDYRGLDSSTRKTVLNEAYSRLDDEGKLAWDNKWRDEPFFLGKNRDGSEAKWKTAKEFLETLKIPQVKKERDNHLVEEMRKMREENEKLRIDRNLEQDEAAIEAELARAKEDFDWEAHDKAKAKKDTLQLKKNQAKQLYEVEQAPSQQASEQEIIGKMPAVEREAYVNFKARNLWFGADKDLSAYAAREHDVIQYSNLSFQEKLEYVEKKVKAAFPSKFPKGTTSFAPTATTTSNSTMKTTGGKNVDSAFNSLPDRDKAKVGSLIASGKFASKEAVLKSFGLI